MQRQALQRIGIPAGKPRKITRKKAVKRPGRPAGAAPAKPRAQTPPGGGKGRWQNFIHKTAPSRSELLGRLTYALYRPAEWAIAGRPLVIMLHGCQQTAADIAAGSRMNQLADRKGFVVAYPQQVKRVHALRCWRWFQPDEGHGLAEADAIADLAATLVSKHRLDATRVYIAGLSAGAGMAGLTMLRHPQIFAAVAMHSGVVLGAARNGTSGLQVMRKGSERDPLSLLAPLQASEPAALPRPALIVHGARDRAVSLTNAIQLAEQFSALNGTMSLKKGVYGVGTPREYTREDYLSGRRVVLRLCVVKEVGHAWSGGDERVKFSSEKGPNASLLMWQFFALHRRTPAH